MPNVESLISWLKPVKDRLTYISIKNRLFCLVYPIKNPLFQWVSRQNAKKLYYINGSVNIRYDGKTLTSIKNLLLQLTSLDICREGTMAGKCKFDFILQLGICLSIPLYIEIVKVRLLMCRDWINNVTYTSPIYKQSNFIFETCK